VMPKFSFDTTMSLFNFKSLISKFTYHMFVLSFVQNQSAASNDVPDEQSPQAGGWSGHANQQPPPSGSWGNRGGQFGWWTCIVVCSWTLWWTWWGRGFVQLVDELVVLSDLFMNLWLCDMCGIVILCETCDILWLILCETCDIMWDMWYIVMICDILW
jgi:hypothetical protein